MKIYILSELITEDLKNKLSEIYSDVVYIDSPQKISGIEELQSDEDKILVIDPDFAEWEVTKEDLENVGGLKAVLVSSTSFSWVEDSLLNENNIPLVNVKDWSTQAVAEWAIMMAQNLSRKIPLLIKDGFPLDYEKYKGTQLRGKTAGILGMGNIGKAIAERANGLEMNVIYWSKQSKSDLGEYASFEDLFKNADYIFPTMADNEEVQKLITDELLSSMKNTAYFVSIVHKYYNHDLLLEMVGKGKIAGYGFEDSKVNMKDLKGNVWVAPEYAWCTRESYANNDIKLLENIKMALQGDFSNRVN